MQLSKGDRIRLSAVTRERTIQGRPPPDLRSTRPTSTHDSRAAIAIEDALKLFPSSPIGRVERVLRNLAALSPVIGAMVLCTDEAELPVFFAETHTTARTLLRHLAKQGLVEHEEYANGDAATLTLDGWSAVEAIQQGTAAPHARQAFVAMAFGGEWRSECERGLSSGVTAAGYRPWIADREDFLGKIDDRVLAEIRRSALVVSDLTGHR